MKTECITCEKYLKDLKGCAGCTSSNDPIVLTQETIKRLNDILNETKFRVCIKHEEKS